MSEVEYKHLTLVKREGAPFEVICEGKKFLTHYRTSVKTLWETLGTGFPVTKADERRIKREEEAGKAATVK